MNYFKLPYHGHILEPQIKWEQGESQLECLIRCIKIRAFPEEFVRQGLIWFLQNKIQLADQGVHNVVAKAEKFRLDLIISTESKQRNFKVSCTNVIVECKSPQNNQLADHVQKLRDSMTSKVAELGLIFNGKQGLLIKGYGDTGLTPITLNDLADFEKNLLERLKCDSKKLRRDEVYFQNARHGCFESLCLLAKKYGMRYRFTISFSSQNEDTTITFFPTVIVNEELLHTSRSRQKRIIVNKNNFRGLIRIRPT